MSAQPHIARRRTDWFRVLADLQYNGINNLDVSRRLGIPCSTLRGYKEGGEPSHTNGDAMLLLWSEATGIAISQRPMTTG